MRLLRLVACAVAVAVLVVHPTVAVAETDDQYPWSVPVEGPVKITDAHFFMYGFHMLECISFKNAADKPLTSVQLRFAYYGRDGSVLEENAQTRTGSFGPGIEIAGAKSSGDAANSARLAQNCWSYKFQKNDPVWIAITVAAVTFAGEAAATAVEKSAMSVPHATVAVARNGEITLNRRPATSDQLVEVLERLKLAHGEVWYTRDAPDREPTPAQFAVFKRIVDAALPLALYTDRTFTTRVPRPARE